MSVSRASTMALRSYRTSVPLAPPRESREGIIVHAGKIGKNEATMRSASGFFARLVS